MVELFLNRIDAANPTELVKNLQHKLSLDNIDNKKLLNKDTLFSVSNFISNFYYFVEMEYYSSSYKIHKENLINACINRLESLVWLKSSLKNIDVYFENVANIPLPVLIIILDDIKFNLVFYKL